MKKIVSIVIIGIFFVSGMSAAVSIKDHSREMTMSEKVIFSTPTLNDQNGYVSISLKEATSYATEPGNPVLPMYTKLIVLPFGATVKDVTYTSSSPQNIQVSNEVLPAPQPSPISDVPIHTTHVIQEKNTEVYTSEHTYPKTRLTYQVGAGLDGNTHALLLSVQYYPVLYIPQQHTISFTPEVTITVTYEPPQNPQSFSESYDLLMIAPSAYSEALQPLLDHKNQHSVNTTLMTVEEITNTYPGRDSAEQIKYAIKDAIETMGVSSVLLMGGVDVLPGRTSNVGFWDEDEGGVLTDMYYADIYDAYGNFSSWDSNQNDQFGESADQVDLYPDVHLGRLACASVEEVNIIVDKIIHYETETYGSDWFDTMIFIGGNTFRWSPGNDGEDNNEILMGIMSQFTPKIIWTSKMNFNRRTISKTITEGAGFFDYSGHGFEHGMGTYTPSGLKMKYYFTPYIKDLKNGYKLPIMFFDACLTAKIDFILQDFLDYPQYRVFDILAKVLKVNTSKRLPCYSWAFLIHEDGGAIATIGATRTAFGGIDSGAGKMSIVFFSAYNSSEFLGQMMTQAQNSYINDVPDDPFTVEEFMLLGDPTLKIGGYPST